MEALLRRSWWMLALRGAAAILFGALALAWPGATLFALVALFAAFAIVTGVSSIIAAVRHREADRGWWMALVLGIVAVAAGILALFRPGITAFVFVVLMGANAIVTGVMDIVMAIRLREQIRGEWLLVLAGIVSLVFGVLVLAYPGLGAFALVWIVSFYALLSGILLLSLAIRLRPPHGAQPPPAPSGGAPAGAR
ncbi:MAG TPA: DUF308 domain-containing protein [Usitatibacter sp.]|nr:DUF308 domain-containing protein [Usitatibacter sp.]